MSMDGTNALCYTQPCLQTVGQLRYAACYYETWQQLCPINGNTQTMVCAQPAHGDTQCMMALSNGIMNALKCLHHKQNIAHFGGTILLLYTVSVSDLRWMACSILAIMLLLSA